MIAVLYEIVVRFVIGLLMSVGIFLLASTIHERSHWLVGRIWSTDLTIIRKYGLFPASVDFGSPYDIPPYGIRLAGIAPFLVGIPVSAVLFLNLDYPIQFELLLTVPFWAAAILSPSDLLAFLYPKRFQEMAVEDASLSHVEILRMLVQESALNYENSILFEELTSLFGFLCLTPFVVMLIENLLGDVRPSLDCTVGDIPL